MSQYASYSGYIGGGTGVTSLNSLTGALTLVAGTGISITPAGSNITIAATGGTGTVTSVGLALPASVFSVSGSPVTTSGTLTGSFATQTANTLFAGPASGGAAVPTFRAAVNADLAGITTLPALILPKAQVLGDVSSVPYFNGSGVLSDDTNVEWNPSFTPAYPPVASFGFRAKTDAIDANELFAICTTDTAIDSAMPGVVLFTGQNTAVGATNKTGAVGFLSGAVTDATASADTGDGILQTGNNSGLGSSGTINISTGNSFDSGSGTLKLSTGNGLGIGNSGGISIQSGDAVVGDSGGITLQIGSAAGTRGKIGFVDGSEGVSGYVWTSTDTAGNGAWMVSGGGGSPGGANTNVQFNDSGSFGGTADFTFDKTIRSLTVGSSAIVSGEDSISLGNNTQVTGDAAQAFGDSTQAQATSSHAEGSSSDPGNLGVASGISSHSEGIDCIASGDGSHAEGNTTQANGNGAHAGGLDSRSDGSNSFVHGEGLNAQSQNQFVVGNFNTVQGSDPFNPGDYTFIVGNGVDDSGRSNAFAITNEGLIIMDQGGHRVRVREIDASPYTINATIDYIVVALLTVPGAVAFTLPDGEQGMEYYVKDGTGDALTNNITISASGADTFQDGSASDVININFGVRHYAFSGGVWYAVGSL